MTKYKVISTTNQCYIVEAWSESDVIWLMSYEEIEVKQIDKL